MIVWRVTGKIIRSALCSILCNSCAQCSAHMNISNSSLDWVLSQWGNFSLCLNSFLGIYVFCVYYYCILECPQSKPAAEAAAVIIHAAAAAVQRPCMPTSTTATQHRPVLLLPLGITAANCHRLSHQPTTLWR